MNKKQIEDEFLRIADVMVHQGDIDVLCDLITLDRKKDFIDEWKKEE